MPQMLQPPIVFRARVVAGAGRGKKLGIPTMNLDLSDVPGSLSEGIYACVVAMNGNKYQGALHYGPRPVFDGSRACEVHIINSAVEAIPAEIDLEIIARLRDVQSFPSPAALVDQIQKDIADTRQILSEQDSQTASSGA